RHGSCGLGIGECAQDALEFPSEAIRAAELRRPEALRKKLLRQQQRKWEVFSRHQRELRREPQGALELAVLESAQVSDRWIAQTTHLAEQVAIAPAVLR